MSSLPHHIGHFKVLSELGRGGMGIVYKVKHDKTGAIVALKMIPPEALSRADSELRFKREFRAMQRVEHPNVIRVFDAGTHDGCPFFTMELVEGCEIRRFVDGDAPIVINGRDGPPNTLTAAQRSRLNDPGRVKTVADLIVQVAFALTEIHSHRIVHRDLKPDNIIVSRAGVAKLMDFGIAKQLSNTNEHSSDGMVVGTFKYLSPEQALGGEIDGRADLYCLGIILYELLTGRHPFYSENSVGYAYHHAKKTPPDIEKFNPGVHQGLKAVCDKLVKKDPRERFPTAEDVIAAVREAVEGASVPIETSTRQRASPQPVRNLPFELAQDQVFAPALVGRDQERRQLVGAAERLLVGEGCAVIVTGPPGIGKTRLLKEVANEVKQKNIDFLWGHCSPQGGPYHPYIEVLDTLVTELQARPAAELKQVLADDGGVLARYLPSLQSMPPDVRPRPVKALEPQGERQRFMSAATSFLSRLSAVTGRVVVIDSLHLADELSLSLTRHLVETIANAEAAPAPRREAPIALALTIDPGHQGVHALATLLQRLSVPGRNNAGLSPIGLLPLPTPAVREMLASMLGGDEVAEVLAEYLHDETKGVPGAIEERVRAWVESGELRRSSRSQGRHWVFAKASDAKLVEVRAATRWDIPVPDFNESPNAKRIARLGPVARDVAERVAVIGERVVAGLLERAALRPQEELIDALDELLKRDILVEDEGGAIYRFNDNDDRKALLGSLQVERKQNLHLLAARAVVDHARRLRRPVNPEELSVHYLEAKDTVSAIEQLMAAARTALTSSATQTAAQRVREAQELLAQEQKSAGERGGPKDSRLMRADIELVLLRLDVLAAVNEHRECVTLAQRRLPRMYGTVDGSLQAEVLLRLAASERVLGDLDAALQHTGEVLSRTERGGSHALRCRAKGLCGLIYEQRGSFDLAERYFTDALELAHTIGDEIEEEQARQSIAARRLTTGDLEEAGREFEHLLHTANARGEKLRVSHYVNALGVVAHERNRLDQAEAAYRRVIELAKPAGDRRSLATALNNLAVIRRDVGDYDEALVLTSKAARILVDLDQVESLAYLRIVEAQILLDRAAATGNASDNADALKKADEALDLSLKATSALKVAEAAMCRGLALCRTGDAVGRDDIERGIRAAVQINANRIVLFGVLCDVETRAAAGDTAGAERSLHDGLDRAGRTGFVRFELKLRALQDRLRLG
jgi:predicted ATPase/tRNA A-37 threonylcarbamoyl transferase component Bud32